MSVLPTHDVGHPAARIGMFQSLQTQSDIRSQLREPHEKDARWVGEQKHSTSSDLPCSAMVSSAWLWVSYLLLESGDVFAPYAGT